MIFTHHLQSIRIQRQTYQAKRSFLVLFDSLATEASKLKFWMILAYRGKCISVHRPFKSSKAQILNLSWAPWQLEHVFVHIKKVLGVLHSNLFWSLSWFCVHLYFIFMTCDDCNTMSDGTKCRKTSALLVGLWDSDKLWCLMWSWITDPWKPV